MSGTKSTTTRATTVKVAQAKGRPMLSWVGKRPLREVRTYPAQEIERFAIDGATSESVDWSEWPTRFDRGGLLFHGDNKEVLAYLLANGFRGKVDLIYIDPPFDSGADYVRRVQLRGASGTARLDGESYTLGEQIQYTDIWANDNYLQFAPLHRHRSRPGLPVHPHLFERRMGRPIGSSRTAARLRRSSADSTSAGNPPLCSPRAPLSDRIDHASA